jgi:hypothetical protein
MNLLIVGQFLSMYLNDQIQTVKLFHNQSTEQDTPTIDFTMKMDLDGIQTKLIRQIDLLDFGLKFDPFDVEKVSVTSQFSALFALPSNIQMIFEALTTTMNLTLRSNDGSPMSQIILRDAPIEHNQTTNELRIRFDEQRLLILNETSFEQFAANLVQTSNISVTIEGLAAILLEVQIGNLTLFDIPINARHSILLVIINLIVIV